MTDPEIKVGDACHDLVERGKVIIVDKAADSVAEHKQSESYDIQTYKSHPLLNVSEDEPVFTAVYLPSNPTVKFSDKYDFPRSRLSRIPVENAGADLKRVQHQFAVALCKGLLTVYDTIEDDDVHRLEVAIEEVLGEERASEVFELVDVEQRFGGDNGGA